MHLDHDGGGDAVEDVHDVLLGLGQSGCADRDEGVQEVGELLSSLVYSHSYDSMRETHVNAVGVVVLDINKVGGERSVVDDLDVLVQLVLGVELVAQDGVPETADLVLLRNSEGNANVAVEDNVDFGDLLVGVLGEGLFC